MASRWPAVGASLRRRSLQNQEQLEESEALQPVAGHPDTSSGALGSLCRQFQRRLPLRANKDVTHKAPGIPPRLNPSPFPRPSQDCSSAQDADG
ncbi:unnamed protein product [Rangifer tarandus platyrhynchus]|uniref:Uncharacterized protein n=2 Tax=Rangifer tarandus platyrhynchus TaxID=3082113 RepID=A0ABN8ZXS9_RANTA|nr:unnamed protein product [Rangifer tarandus platyrhynchus]CAI9712274.1 unnamed protein product [Rangifer tarandus platyrhynchus]